MINLDEIVCSHQVSYLYQMPSHVLFDERTSLEVQDLHEGTQVRETATVMKQSLPEAPREEMWNNGITEQHSCNN